MRLVTGEVNNVTRDWGWCTDPEEYSIWQGGVGYRNRTGRGIEKVDEVNEHGDTDVGNSTSRKSQVLLTNGNDM